MNNNNSTVKLITILDYIGILFVLGFFVEKDNEDVKFHTNQGIILCLFNIVVSIVASVLRVFHRIPFVGWTFSLVASLLWLLVAAMIILGIVHAAKGERTPLPVIGQALHLHQIKSQKSASGGILQYIHRFIRTV